MSSSEIAIVGMACVFPQADTLGQYWSNLVNGVDAVSDLPPRRWHGIDRAAIPVDHDGYIPCLRGGFVQSELMLDPLSFGVMPNTVRHGDADQFLLLKVIADALGDANVGDDDPVRERTDVIVGRGGYPTYKHMELNMRAEMIDLMLEMIGRRFPDLLANGRRAAVDDSLRSMLSPNEADTVSTSIPNIAASRAANRLNLMGAAYTVDAACASSLVAVENAVWRLRQRQSDLAAAAGVFLTNTPTFAHVFVRLGALSPNGVIRPFDRRADGLVIGEGAGALILKRLEDACRDGDRVYAVIKGIGQSSDGRDVDVLAPSRNGQIRALRRAYQDAGVDPESIGYLEAHGTGTLAGDRTEVATLKAFFGTSDGPPTRRGMGSVKSMIGHTMPASGMASLIKAALSLSNKTLAPSLHCEQPHPDLADAPFYLVTETRSWVHDHSSGPRRAAVNAFGFGGANVHVVLEELVAAKRSTGSRGVVPREFEAAVRRDSELIALAAPSTVDLGARLRQLCGFLDNDESKATLADVAYSLSRHVELSNPCKLAFVCRDVEHLKSLVDSLAGVFESGATEIPQSEGIYFSADAARPPGKVACLFPGMGFPGLTGNYPDHLMELCLHYPEAREEFDFFEARDRHPQDTVPTSVIFSPPSSLPESFRKQLKKRLAIPNTNHALPDQNIPQERYLSAMGVTLANWASWQVFRKFGVPVDMVAGQSQGEMAALCAAGSCDFHATAPFYWKTLNVDMQYKQGDVLAFVYLSEERIAPLLEEYLGTHICIHVTPESVVLGGESETVNRLAERLRGESILVHIMPYPPIHSPRLRHLRAGLNDALTAEHVDTRAPQIAVYSSIRAELYPDDPHEIRDTFAMNLDHPVRMWQTIHRLYDDGARIFVQVGSGHIASHVKTLLPDGAHVLSTAFDLDTRSPLTQINHLCAALFTAASPINFTPLYEFRRIRELDLDQPQKAVPLPHTAVPLRIDWSPLYSENCAPRLESVERKPSFVAGESPARREGEGSPPRNSCGTHHPPQSGAAASTGMPFIGRIAHCVPEREVVIERTLTLDEDHFLVDHCLAEAQTVKPVRECLPTMPMTMSIELMAEAGALLCPAARLIGLKDVRALHWIALKECSETALRIVAHRQSQDGASGVRCVYVDVFCEDRLCSSATVQFADAYPHDLGPRIAEHDSDGGWPFSAEEVYAENFMFHGPRFQVVSRLDRLGNPAFSGELTVFPHDRLFASTPGPVLVTDPCVLDGCGQLVGLWCMAFHWTVFPIAVEKIEIYSPTPAVGLRIPVRCEVTEFDVELKTVRVDIEVEDGEGGIWMRLTGWTDWLFKWSAAFQEWLRTPDRRHLAEELDPSLLPGRTVFTAISTAAVRSDSMDRTPRVVLNSREMATFLSLNDSHRQKQFLASRIAAKDAARLWASRYEGADRVHPAMFCVEHDDLGRPYLVLGEEPVALRLSIAHCDSLAVALVSDMAVGIDVEPMATDAKGILHDFATGEEIPLIESMAAIQPEMAWPTRLWCAKEAVGKLLGTGLQGRPKDFQAIDADEFGQILVFHLQSGHRYTVTTMRVDEAIVAYANVESAVAEPAVTE